MKHSSSPNKHLAGLRDPMSLWRFRPPGQTKNDKYHASEAVSSKVAQSRPWDSQIADVKKTHEKMTYLFSWRYFVGYFLLGFADVIWFASLRQPFC